MTNTRAQEAGRIDALFKEHEQQLTELRGTLACHDQRFDQLKTDNREMLRDFIAQQAQGRDAEPQGTEAGQRGTAGGGGCNLNTSRIGKMEFPRFARDDVEGWICHCWQFFEFDATPENSKVKLSLIHLEGKVL